MDFLDNFLYRWASSDVSVDLWTPIKVKQQIVGVYNGSLPVPDTLYTNINKYMYMYVHKAYSVPVNSRRGMMHAARIGNKP